MEIHRAKVKILTLPRFIFKICRLDKAKFSVPYTVELNCPVFKILNFLYLAPSLYAPSNKPLPSILSLSNKPPNTVSFINLEVCQMFENEQL